MVIDIPSFGFDAGGSRYNPNETVITTANLAALVQKWAYPTTGKVRSSPVVDGTNGLCFIGSRDAKVHGINTTTGLAIAGYPIIVDGMVDSTPYYDRANNRLFVATKGDGATYGKVYCFNRAGATVWGPYTTNGPVGSHINSDGTNIYFSDDKGYAYALVGATGAQAWAPILLGTATASLAGVGMPALVGANVVYAISDGVYVRVAATGAAVRVMNCRQNAAFSEFGSEAIRYTSGGGPACYVVGGVTYLLIGATDQWLYMFDYSTGHVVWPIRLTGDNLASSCFDPVELVVVNPRHDGTTVTYDLKMGDLAGLHPYFSATGPATGPQSSPCIAGTGGAGAQMCFAGQMAPDSRMFGWIVGGVNSPPFKSWALGLRNDTYSSPVVANGLVIWGNDDQNVYAFGP